MPLLKSRPCTSKSGSDASRQHFSGRRSSSTSTPTTITNYTTSTSTDKSSQAAQMAQELASQSSWADRYFPSRAEPIMTPPESIADTHSQVESLEAPPSYEESHYEHHSPQTAQEYGFWRADGMPIPPLPQRNYVRHETSSAISGTFTFYDGLDLSTTSGSINIVIDPQPSEKVGTINLTASSGSIRVRFSEEYMKSISSSGLLDRCFDIQTRTSSGSQTIEIPIGSGSRTSLTSQTGSMSAKLYMTRGTPGIGATTLSTESTHGSQNIKVKSLVQEPFTSLAGNLHAKNSGTIRLDLPSTWQGMVHASSSGHGSVDVKGDGLQYQRYGNKETYAWRAPKPDEIKPKTEGQVIELIGDGDGSLKINCSA